MNKYEKDVNTLKYLDFFPIPHHINKAGSGGP